MTGNPTLDTILQILGVIAAISAGIKGLQHLFGISPTGKLVARMEKAEEKLSADYQRLEKMDSRIAEIERKLDDTKAGSAQITEILREIGKSQIQMLYHMANGNGREELIKEAERLTEFLLKVPPMK